MIVLVNAATLLNRLALLALALYRAVGSLWLGGSCRFEPSCSVYAEQAIGRFGLRVGGPMVLRRVCRCRPGGPFGYDPVPETENAGKDFVSMEAPMEVGHAR